MTIYHGHVFGLGYRNSQSPHEIRLMVSVNKPIPGGYQCSVINGAWPMDLYKDHFLMKAPREDVTRHPISILYSAAPHHATYDLDKAEALINAPGYKAPKGFYPYRPLGEVLRRVPEALRLARAAFVDYLNDPPPLAKDPDVFDDDIAF